MVRRWRLVLGGAAVLVACAAGGGALLLNAALRPGTIEQAVSRATGRSLRIAGPVHVVWGVNPGLSAADVSLANMAGGSRPEMVRAGRVEARLALLPLLRGAVEVTQATLSDADILLETDASGRGNWQFERPTAASPAANPAAGGGQRRPMRVDVLSLQSARVTWHDGRTGQTVAGSVTGATLQQLGDTVQLAAAGRLAGLDLTVDAHAPATMGSSPLLAAVAAEVTVRAGPADLAAILPGATLAGASLTWPAGGPGRFEATGTLAGQPWHASSSALPAGRRVALRGLQLTSPVGDLAGDVVLGAETRPSARGSLVSDRLDVDGVRGLLAAARPVPAAPAPGGAGVGPAAPDAPVRRVFSDQELPWARLRAADVDLQLDVGTLHLGGTDYRAAKGHLVMNDGAVALDPFSVVAPEGPVELSASADARAVPPPVALRLRSGGFAVDPLLQVLGLPGGSRGAAELDVVLSAAGGTPHALAASLTGHVGVALVDGSIANAALATLAGGALKSAGLGIEPGGSSAVRCLAVRLDARAGQVTVAGLTLDTSRLLLEGGGTADLAAEQVALNLNALLRLGAAGVAVPVRVEGPLGHPTAAMGAPDGKPGRAGITIGSLAAPADECAAALALARDGRAGAPPAAVAAAKPLKPADLLRSLLR